MSTLHGCVDATVELYPSRTAVVYDDGSNKTILTYSELSRRSDEISASINSHGVSRATVACLCETTTNTVDLVLGVLKASCAFAFLRPECPEKHIKALVDTKTPVYLVAMKSLYDQHCLATNDEWSVLDTFWESKFIFASYRGNARKQSEQSTLLEPQMAYTMFTSGTTGEPKVVRVPHECALLNVQHLRSIFNISKEDIIFQAAPMTFDPCVIEIFLALTTGAQLVLTSEAVKRIPRAVTQLLVDNSVSVIQATPSFVQSLGFDRIQNLLLSEASCLRVLALGGEECPSGACINLWRQPGNRTAIYNLYGITEVSCWATFYRISATNTGVIPLGTPLDGTLLEVRDDSGALVQEGEGTLFVGGSARRCLVGNEEWKNLNPCQMRCSGDRVRKSSDGLIFLGRKDSIFKYHGKKINPPYLATQLLEMGMIQSCHTYFSKAERTLYFFLILHPTCIDQAVTRQLIQRLQKECQCPFQVEVVPRWPLTSHGKIDVEALVAYQKKRRLQGSFPDLHMLLARLWNTSTTRNDSAIVCGDSEFVAAGGNSLGAVSISQELEFASGIPLPLLVDKILNEKFSDVEKYLYAMTESHKQLSYPIPAKRAKLHVPSWSVSPESAHVKRSSCFTCITRFETWQRCCCAESCHQPRTTADRDFQRPTFSERWKYDLQKCIDASPLIVSYERGDTVVFIGSHAGRFCALNEKSGNCFWVISVADRIESSATLSTCGKYVAFGCYDHHIYCADVEDGSVKWVLNTGAEVKSSPTTNRINCSFLCGSHDKSLYCISQNTGSLLWKQRLSEGSIFASPSVSYEPYQIYGATLDGLVAALSPEHGAVVWTCKLEKPIFSSPAVCDFGVGICCVDGKIFLLDHSNGCKLWIAETGGPIFSTLSVSTGDAGSCLVVGCHDNYVYKLSSKDGGVLWKTFLSAPIYSTLFCSHDEKTYVGASTQGKLCIIDSHHGEVLSSYQLDSEVFSSPVVLEDHIIVGCRDNYVYCFHIESKCFS
ncbi:beta-alanine-activating enzyme isoform X2 [Rhipicephalus sanguineus]|uniref:beta-alanine-activating enzyme isoform X2 n=1 Tax=Rhipicephalus sanguineus TaxID=34632 RepID=UPI00189339CF|nr:beta-alanine-activating enzyme isoform X2 [Rhipicephalus sanguineus]